jgi:tight adherence protein B
MSNAETRMITLAVNFVLALLLSFTVLAIYLRRAAAATSMKRRLTTINVAKLATDAIEAVALAKTEAADKGAKARVKRYLRRAPFAEGIEKLLLEANSHFTVLSAAIISGTCALGASVGCYLLLPVPPLVAVAFLLGSAAPYGVISFQRTRRVKAFDAQLPDALDLMTRALRAGHAMSSALELVGTESPAPLGPEFANAFQQQKLGVRFRDAMMEMVDRVPSPDLHFLVTAMLVQRETGGDVTEILERTTEVIRERARIAAEVKTRTAQGRLTGWILGLLPVGLLLMINVVSPGYSSILFHDPMGQKLLYAGGSFIVLGGLVIRKIVDVRV